MGTYVDTLLDAYRSSSATRPFQIPSRWKVDLPAINDSKCGFCILTNHTQPPLNLWHGTSRDLFLIRHPIPILIPTAILGRDTSYGLSSG